ncbi:hypothetical protein WJX79_008479 [Trebouxia sp. C0005]
MILHCNTVLFRCQSTQCQISLILSGVNASRADIMWARQRRLLGLFFRNLLSRLLRLLPFRHLLRQLLTEDLNRLWPNTITPDPNKK